MTNRSEYLIPVTIHLDAATFRMLEATAKRATQASSRRVTVPDLIESRLGATAKGDPARAVMPERTAAEYQSRRPLTHVQQDTLRRMLADGRTGPEIAAVVGCHLKTVSYYRRNLRQKESK